jgi:histidinol-phosphatase
MWRAKPMVERFFRASRIPFVPSRANFILFRPEEPQRVCEVLKSKGFLVKALNFKDRGTMVRMSIGTVAQMKQFIEVYKKACLPVPYAFIDRDGALIFEPLDTYQIDTLEKLRILPGVIAGLTRLQKAGYRLVLVTNQDGLGTSSFPRRDFLIPHTAFQRILARQGIRFDAELICPHFPADNCMCRKPKTLLVDQYLNAQGRIMDRTRSFVCGDRASDEQLA